MDMGSLEQIHSQMGGLRNLNIGIINNISTALAVDIGLGICGNQKLEDILKRASESNVCTYRIIHNVQKEDAVIFSGENGIDTTEKLKELILKTSATSIPVKFVAYDYYRLMKNGGIGAGHSGPPLFLPERLTIKSQAPKQNFREKF